MIGNAITLAAEWNNDVEDEWTFSNNSFFLRWGSYATIDSNVDLIFEFITYAEVKKKLVSLSVCFSEI